MVTTSKIERSGRRILEEQFDGDLQAYAEHEARPRPADPDSESAHPWHQRLALAKATVDLPDDCMLPPDVAMLYTRAEVCQYFELSDSAFGKWNVPPRARSGRYALYALSDVFYYRAAAQYRQGYKQACGKFPEEHLDQLVAMIHAEAAAGAGPPKYWRPKISDHQTETVTQGTLL